MVYEWKTVRRRASYSAGTLLEVSAFTLMRDYCKSQIRSRVIGPNNQALSNVIIDVPPFRQSINTPYVNRKKKSLSEYSDRAVTLSPVTKTRDYTASTAPCQEKGVFHLTHVLPVPASSFRAVLSPEARNNPAPARRRTGGEAPFSRLTFVALPSTMIFMHLIAFSLRSPAGPASRIPPRSDRGTRRAHPEILIPRRFGHAAGRTHTVRSIPSIPVFRFKETYS
jgi:hypothetical protein